MNPPDIKQVVFVMLEGQHDVALLRRALKDLAGFDDDKTTIGKYPAPLAGYMSKRLGQRPVDDRDLSQLGAGDLPLFSASLVRGQRRLLLVRTGGKDSEEAIRAFLTDLKDIAPSDDDFFRTGDRWRMLFMVDADDGTQQRQDELQRRYGDTLGLHDWGWGCWREAGPLHVASLPWCLPDQDTGTLEALGRTWLNAGLAVLLADATQFVHKHGDAGRKLAGISSAREAKREKASLNVVNQLFNPGAALTTLYADGELMAPQAAHCKPLLTLLGH